MTAHLLLALVLAAPAPKDPPKKDPPSIVGRWAVESSIFGGMAVPKQDYTHSFTADGKFETLSECGRTIESGAFTLDPKKNPAEINFTTLDRDGVTPGIYKIDGDTLTLCIGETRPNVFDAPAGVKAILTVYKRFKD